VIRAIAVACLLALALPARAEVVRFYGSDTTIVVRRPPARVITLTVRDTVTRIRDRIVTVSRPRSWWDRNERWCIPLLVLGAGVIGYQLRGKETETRFIQQPSPHDEGCPCEKCCRHPNCKK
jgi:hypothetical protein